MPSHVYKICTATELEEAQARGRFDGSADDRRDGFIHFSARDQLPGTLAKHFAGQTRLVLLTLDPASLGEGLKWEASRGGALFPHLYAPLDLAVVLSVETLPIGADGRHILPLEVMA